MRLYNHTGAISVMHPPLHHNAFITALTVHECVSSIQIDRATELLLASSYEFPWDFDGDYNEVFKSYHAYFESIVSEIEALHGAPVYRGGWKSPDIEPWTSELGLSNLVQDIAIWKIDSTEIYLRWYWEDKELPILVALGAKGCEPTNEHSNRAADKSSKP